MWAFLKGLPIGHYFVMAAILAASYIWMDYKHTQQALADQIELTQQWQHAAEVQQNIDRRDTIILRAGQDAERAIQEAPNARTPVPSDIAIPWANGIDSVRDAGIKPANSEHELSGPSRGEAERTKPDVRGPDPVFYRSGTGFLALQRTT